MATKKITTPCLALALILVAIQGTKAYEPSDYPGSSWGEGTRDLNGIEGYGTMGFVRQGVDWFDLPGNIPVDTYGEYSWMGRSLNRRYYNDYGPGVGIMLSKSIFDFGADFSWDRYPGLYQTVNYYTLFMQWYDLKDWSNTTHIHKIAGIPILGMPLWTWGTTFYDLTHAVEGNGTQGYINQGIDWFKLPWGDAVFDTYAAYNWRLRTLNSTYFNAYGPGLGSQISIGIFKFAVEYDWMKYPQLGGNFNSFQFFFTWYSNWDLKSKKKS